MREHEQHGNWKKKGRCVYCSCGDKLYQGTVPKDIPEFITAWENLLTAVNEYHKELINHD